MCSIRFVKKLTFRVGGLCVNMELHAGVRPCGWFLANRDGPAEPDETTHSLGIVRVSSLAHIPDEPAKFSD